MLLLTSCFTGDWLLQGNVVNTDPHFCASLFQFTPKQFTLAIGRKKTFRIRARRGWGLRGNRTQLSPLTEPTECNDIRMEICCPYSHADEIWNSKSFITEVYRIRKQVWYIFVNCNIFMSSNLSHFVIQPVEFLTLREQLKEKYLFTSMVEFVKKKKKLTQNE